MIEEARFTGTLNEFSRASSRMSAPKTPVPWESRPIRTSHPAASGDQDLGEAVAQLEHRRSLPPERQQPEDEHDGRRGDHLLLHEVAAAALRIGRLGQAAHELEPDEVGAQVDGDIHAWPSR